MDTTKQYMNLDDVYGFFNKKLFDNELPECMITINRSKQNTLGYFSPDRFKKLDSNIVCDEISLNPIRLGRDLKLVMATLVHEMCHLWQHHFDKTKGRKYHNKKWGNKMESLGLMPSNTGAQGGKKTGQQMDHYIIPDGKFEKVFRTIQNKKIISYIDAFEYDKKINEISEGVVPVEGLAADTSVSVNKKDRSKVKYNCPECDSNVWGKEGLYIICGDCDCSFNEK